MIKQQRLTSCIAFLVGGIAASGAYAQSPVSNVSADVYGQINHGIMVSDTGDGSEHYIVDNDNSATRTGVKLSGDLKEVDLTVGAHVELEYQQNASNLVDPDNRSIGGEFNERHLNLFVSGGFGKLSLGQGDGAANGNVEVDLSGTKIVSYTNPALVGGALEFVDDSGGGNVRLGAAMSDQDFESRYDRLRYDLPGLGPVSAAISQGIKGNADVTEVGARFSGELGGKVSAGLGYSTKDMGGATGDVETLGGSLSWLHDSGVNLTGAYSTSQDDDSANPDSDFYLVKLGYKAGKHAFDVHFAEAKDRVQEGDSVETIGAGYVFSPIKWFSAYAGYNNHSLDRDGADFDDVSTVLMGGILKF